VLCAVQSETAACVLCAVQSEAAACVLCAVQNETETCRGDITMYFNVNLKPLTTLINIEFVGK